MGERRRVSAYRLVATPLGLGLQFAVLSVQQTGAIMYSKVSSHLLCAAEHSACHCCTSTLDRARNSGMMMMTMMRI